MRHTTQIDRVLLLLRQRGTNGLNTVDLHSPTCDGGKPILRLAARIQELQDRGHEIRSQRRSNGTASYFLCDAERGSDPQPPCPEPLRTVTVAAPLDVALFDDSEYSPPPTFRDAA